jgi:gas vesicle protein
MHNGHNEQHMDGSLPLKTAIFGAIVGAAAVMFSRKDTREEIRDGLRKMFDAGEKKLDDVIDDVENTKKTIAKKVDKTTKALQA